jgi:hypothetical protein
VTTLRRAHGAAAAGGRLVVTECPPVDELPAGLPDDAGDAGRAGHGPDGRFQAGNADAAKGGRRKAGKLRLARRLGLAELPVDAAFGPYRRAAATWARAQCSVIASSVGGGVCGPGPSSIVASGAIALAWSRYFSDQAATTGDPELAKLAIKCATEHRGCLRDAHGLARAEADGRPRVNPLDVVRARLGLVAIDASEPEPEEPLS